MTTVLSGLPIALEAEERLAPGEPESGTVRIDPDPTIEALSRLTVALDGVEGEAFIVPGSYGIDIQLEGLVVALDGAFVLPLLAVCPPLPAPALGAQPGENHFVSDRGSCTKGFR